MNYKKIYDALIEYRKNNKLVKSDSCYCEEHHITPKCMNGSDNPSNLVNLTAREHYIAHLLLWKHYKCINPWIGEALRKAITAMQMSSWCTPGRQNFRFNGRLYEKIRIESNLSNRNCIVITDGNTNKHWNKKRRIPAGWRKGTTNHNFKDTRMITNGSINRRIKIDDPLPDGFRYGTTPRYKRIAITNGKRRKFIKAGEQIPPGWKRGTPIKPCLGKKSITNGKITKFVNDDCELSDGWKYGSTRNGKIYITDGKHNKIINKDDLIPTGWKSGITMKCKDRHGIKPIKNERLQLESRLKPNQHLSKKMKEAGWEYGLLESHLQKIRTNNQNKSWPKHDVCKGTIWVTNGRKNLRVKSDSIPPGYKPGRKMP